MTPDFVRGSAGHHSPARSAPGCCATRPWSSATLMRKMKKRGSGQRMAPRSCPACRLLDKAPQQALARLVARHQLLGMKLYRDCERMVRVLQALDDAVGRARHDLEDRRNVAHRLVVQAIHWHLGRAEQVGKPGV